MKYKIDVVRIRENSIELNGWVIGKDTPVRAEFQVQDGKPGAGGISLCGNQTG